MITGEAVKCVRRIRGIKQLELARRTGLKQPYLSAIELGSRVITDEQQAVLLNALRIAPETACEVSRLAQHLHEIKVLEAKAWRRLREILAANSV